MTNLLSGIVIIFLNFVVVFLQEEIPSEEDTFFTLLKRWEARREREKAISMRNWEAVRTRQLERMAVRSAWFTS